MIRMRSTNYVGCSAGLLAALALGTAEAQTPSVKIGVVNMTALIEQSPQTQAVMAKLRDEFSPRDRDLRAMQDTLKTKQETYQRDSAVMGPDERANLEREIRDGARDFERLQSQLTEDFNIRRNEALCRLTLPCPTGRVTSRFPWSLLSGSSAAATPAGASRGGCSMPAFPWSRRPVVPTLSGRSLCEAREFFASMQASFTPWRF